MHIIYGQQKDLPKRIAVRAVLRQDDKIGIIYVEKYDCLIFPGGGVDDGEGLIEALKREMLEEAGFKVLVKDHILTTETSEVNHTHVNHYYECEILEKIDVSLTDLELELGIKFEWRRIDELFKYYMNNDDDLRFGEHNKLVQKSIKSRGYLLLNKYLLNDKDYINLLRNWIGKEVEVKVDRPIGYKDNYDRIYPINYGYINDVFSLDGEELDAYIIGEEESLKTYKGKVIAVVHRDDDEEIKLVVSNKNYSIEDIKEKIDFNEKYFKSKIIKEG